MPNISLAINALVILVVILVIIIVWLTCLT